MLISSLGLLVHGSRYKVSTIIVSSRITLSGTLLSLIPKLGIVAGAMSELGLILGPKLGPESVLVLGLGLRAAIDLKPPLSNHIYNDLISLLRARDRI